MNWWGWLRSWLPISNEPRLTVSVPQQRMRKLTDEEMAAYQDKIAESGYPAAREWWVCEFTHDDGKTWKIVAAYPVTPALEAAIETASMVVLGDDRVTDDPDLQP